jgi:Lon protease-like protein
MNPDPRISSLPTTLHLLPLESLLLLPETAIPVTITDFAARGIVEAALAAGGYVGVIQEISADGPTGSRGRFYSVGCLGHVVDLGRDGDGHRILLEGMIRFRVRAELPLDRDPLPRATVDYDEFLHDLAGGGEEPAGWDLELFKEKIVEFGRKQFGTAGILESMSPRQVVLFMAQTAPFTPAEKQALLESGSLRDLVDTLARLLSLNYLTTTPDTSPPAAVN